MINDWRAKWADYTDGATRKDFPFGWGQLNSCGKPDAYKNPLFDAKHTNCGICAPQCNVSCLGELHEWGDVVQGGEIDNGFPCLRYAQSNALSLPKTFQAVIIDTPVASGSIHSPFKQPCGRRLARGGLAVAYNMKELHTVNPVVDSVKLRGDSIVVTVGGLRKPEGLGVLTATTGAEGFEVLGNCGNTSAPVCWQSAPIVSHTTTTITLSNLPANPTAIRFMWYLAPYGVTPAQAPVYVGNLAPMPSGVPPLPGEFANEQLPLGPFLHHLVSDDGVSRSEDDSTSAQAFVAATAATAEAGVAQQLPPTCTFRSDTGYANYVGGATVHAPSKEVCCARCWADRRCVVSVFVSGGCYLKWSRDKPVQKPGVMSCDTGRAPPPCEFPWDCPMQWHPLQHDEGRAQCMDGSNYGFYHRAGADRSRYVVELSGGGWCYTEGLCWQRAADHGPGSKGSSKGWPQNRTLNEGVTSTDPVMNPLFFNASHAFLDYCDGASFTGFRAEPWDVSGAPFGPGPSFAPPNSTVMYRGAANLEAAIRRLMADHGLGEAQELLLTGGSAGGLATMLNVDRVQRIVGPGVRVTGLSNAGYFKAEANHTAQFPYDPSANFTANMRYLAAMQNTSGSLSARCQSTHAAQGLAWKCMLAAFAEPFIEAPLFILQSKFDHFQLDAELGLRCMNPSTAGQPYSPPWRNSTCTAADTAKIAAYGAQYWQQIAATVRRPRLKRGVFLDACIIHGQTGSAAWNWTLVNGMAPAAAFASWYGDEAPSVDRGGKWIENCTLPCNANTLACAPY
jgi:hypothetical protein